MSSSLTRKELLFLGFVREYTAEISLFSNFPDDIGRVGAAFYHPFFMRYKNTFKEILNKLPFIYQNSMRGEITMQTFEQWGFKFAFKIKMYPEGVDPAMWPEDPTYLRFGIEPVAHPNNMKQYESLQYPNDDGALKECEWRYSCQLKEMESFSHYRSYCITKDDYDLNSLNDFGDYSLCVPVDQIVDMEEEIEFIMWINVDAWTTVNGNNAITGCRNANRNMKAETIMEWDLTKIGNKDVDGCVIGAECDYGAHFVDNRCLCGPLSNDKCWCIQLDSKIGEVRISWYDKPERVGGIEIIVHVMVFWDKDREDTDASYIYTDSGNLMWRRFKSRGANSMNWITYTGRGSAQAVTYDLHPGRKLKKIKMAIDVKTVWDRAGKEVDEKDWSEYGIIQEGAIA